MLLEFSVANYGCFKDEATLSLVRPGFRTLYPRPGDDWPGVTFRVASIFGANASGKSTLLVALSRLQLMMSGQPAPWHAPFRLDESSVNQPTLYQVDFVNEGRRYNYLIEVNRWGIQREELWEAHGRWRKLFVRTQETAAAEAHIEFGASLRGPNREIWRITTPQTPFLGVGRLYQHPVLAPIAQELMLIRMINHTDDERDVRLEWLSRHVADARDQWGPIANEIARMADLGIESVKVVESKIPPEVRDRFQRVLAALNEGEDVEKPEEVLAEVQRSLGFSHRGSDGKLVQLGAGDQSEGTLTWLATAGPAMEALAYGRVLLIDELDASLHPVLTRELVSLFKDPELNQHGAQLIFTTHDVALLDNAPTAAVEPGESWVTAKSNKGDSELYCLADFKDIRQGSNMQKRYLAGKFGGLPQVDRTQLRELLLAMRDTEADQ